MTTDTDTDTTAFTPADIRPFTVTIDDAAVADLRDRLAHTRWPVEADGAGTDFGLPLEVARDWAARWSDVDFAALQARLNRFPQFITEVDSQRIHFWHVRSSQPDALPLLLLHGWPATVLEFEHVIALLTEPDDGRQAFDVVVPSILGTGFSGPTRQVGWDAARTAAALDTLMNRLGYANYGAAGNDLGALVARELGILAPPGLLGVHVLQFFAFPSGDEAESARLTPEDWASLQGGTTAQFQAKAGYQDMQIKRPATVGYALDDSPAGALTWNGDFWSGWGDGAASVDVEDFLRHLSVYWFTQTSGSAARLYRENALTGAGYRDLPISVPVAVAVPPEDYRSIRACVERSANLVRYTELPRGGHFAYLTDPDLVVGDLREFFGSL
ncbi:MAG: epoxide hydrolase [Propionicimonas sp.]|uniref:epoxide hydrolase family protein n=1 Tax=Propionicimonas sp. TaxID=1955623 RepID=UPI002B1FA5F2|nr:epoxide hydrolase [Propionicimonas sp.]MEA4945381.1 epoxide hydrolase [Propionicimonas sp.]